MQLSADLPSGPNVVKEKGIAFMHELEKNDPQRFARLQKHIFRDRRRERHPAYPPSQGSGLKA